MSMRTDIFIIHPGVVVVKILGEARLNGKDRASPEGSVKARGNHF